MAVARSPRFCPARKSRIEQDFLDILLVALLKQVGWPHVLITYRGSRPSSSSSRSASTRPPASLTSRGGCVDALGRRLLLEVQRSSSVQQCGRCHGSLLAALALETAGDPGAALVP
jgi:hypothetical protein